MPEIRVTFKPSLGKLAGKFGNVKVQSFLQGKIRELAFLVEREAKQVTPVDTGRLRASIRVLPIIRPLEAIIQPHTEYAIYVHEGTRYMRGRPFMYWGAKSAAEGFETRLSKQLESHIQGKIK
jgi:HK97 gp10 family phage protein